MFFYAYSRPTDNTCRIQTGLYMYKYYDIMHLTSYVLYDRNRKGSHIVFFPINFNYAYALNQFYKHFPPQILIQWS